MFRIITSAALATHLRVCCRWIPSEGIPLTSFHDDSCDRLGANKVARQRLLVAPGQKSTLRSAQQRNSDRARARRPLGVPSHPSFWLEAFKSRWSCCCFPGNYGSPRVAVMMLTALPLPVVTDWATQLANFLVTQFDTGRSLDHESAVVRGLALVAWTEYHGPATGMDTSTAKDLPPVFFRWRQPPPASLATTNSMQAWSSSSAWKGIHGLQNWTPSSGHYSRSCFVRGTLSVAVLVIWRPARCTSHSCSS